MDDCIEKVVQLAAPGARVRRALSDQVEFGKWFRAEVDAPFEGAGVAEPHTLVELRLEETATGTRLTITESGFSALSSTYRREVFRDNTDGWNEQVTNIVAYVET